MLLCWFCLSFHHVSMFIFFFFFQAEDGIRDYKVTGVQTCALPIYMSMHIPAGMTVALVGPSGAGKTTLVSLLIRFYDPAAGKIVLDGRDIRTITLASLRQNIALVLQEPVLFG